MTLNEQTFLYGLLKRKNPQSDLLNDSFWGKTANMSEITYSEVKFLLRKDHVSDAEMLIKNL